MRFIHPLLVADSCLKLGQFYDEQPDTLFNCIYETEADYMCYEFYEFPKDSEYIHPDICFPKLKHEGIDAPENIASYLMEIFDATLPRYRIASGNTLSELMKILLTGVNKLRRA